MTNRVDWLRIVVWTAISMAACTIANVLFWLAQQALLVAWPIAKAVGEFIQANADRIETGLLVLAVIGLATWTVRRQ